MRGIKIIKTFAINGEGFFYPEIRSVDIILKGNRYSYKIFVKSLVKNYYFSIKATHKETKKSSYITTVNLFLNELEISDKDSRFWESDWIITKKEMKKFTGTAKQLLSDRDYLPYFENFLDIDRNESEWENIEV